MLTKNNSYKYETLYKVSFVITQCFTNGTKMLKYGVTQIHTLRHINWILKLNILIQDYV